MDFFDIHSHVFPDHVAERVINQLEGYYGLKWEGSGVLADLKLSLAEAGVRRTAVFSCATKPEQVEVINNYLAELQASAPETFYCFGTIHPEYRDIPGEIARLRSLGLRGLKLHPDFLRYHIDDPAMLPVYECAGDSLPMLFHVGDPYQDYSAPRRLARVLDMMPGLLVIAAHLGGYRAWEEGRRHLVGRDIYLDSSSAISYLGRAGAKDIILKHGTDKVLWASDYPAVRHCKAQEEINSLGLSIKDLELICFRNAEKLLC